MTPNLAKRSGQLIALLALLLQVTVHAATYIVNTTADDIPSASGQTSLRDAITAANSAGGSNTIVFDSTVFASGTPVAITIFYGGLPSIASDLTITGPGAKVLTVQRLSGVGFRIFTIAPGHNVSISGLNITGGSVVGTTGANGVSGGAAPVAGGQGTGGGILNQANLKLSDCVIQSNTAYGGAGGNGASGSSQNGATGNFAMGGGMYSDGPMLSVQRCTFYNNAAVAGNGGTGSPATSGTGSGKGGPGGWGWGGGLFINASSTATIMNSTFFNNFADGGTGGDGGGIDNSTENLGGVGGNAEGGGIFSYFTANVTVLNCTIDGNQAAPGPGGLQTDYIQNANPGPARGGGLIASSGTVAIGSTIVARNESVVNGTYSPADVYGTFNSMGYNLIGAIGGSTTGLTGTTDQSGSVPSPLDPKFDPIDLFTDVASQTPTIGLLAGSPAIDKGKDFALLGTDQRGRNRPYDNPAIANAPGGDGSDIGAFEVQAPAPEIAVEDPGGMRYQSGDSVDFGVQEVATSGTRDFTIRNLGALTLNLTGSSTIAITGSDAGLFSVSVAPSVSISSSASTTFSVAFMPASQGTRSAQLTIASNDTFNSPFTLNLTAGAADTVTLPPVITSPLSNSTIPPTADFTYVLPEAGLVNSLVLSFNNGQRVLELDGAGLATAGTHAVNLGSVPLTPGTYSLGFSYQDALGHPAASVTSTNVSIHYASVSSAAYLSQSGTAPGVGTNGLPANATLTAFGPPAIDGAGNIAYLAKWASGRIRGSGLFLNKDKCLAIVTGTVSNAPEVKFRRFTDPVIDSGIVACIATLNDPNRPDASMVLTTGSAGGVLHFIARARDYARDASGNFSTSSPTFASFKDVAASGSSVAFLAVVAGGTGAEHVSAANNTGLWVAEGANPPREYLRTGDNVGGFVIKSFTSFSVGSGSPGQGRGWITTPSGPAVTVLARSTGNAEAIIQSGSGGAAILSRSGISGLGGPSIQGASFASYSLPAEDSAGDSAFLGKLTLSGTTIKSTNSQAVFANLNGTAAFGYVPLARVTGSAVGIGATFSVLKDPVMAEDGGIAFPATLHGAGVVGAAASTIWWMAPGGTLELLAQGGARPGKDLPAAAQWNSFTSLGIAANRGPIFSATMLSGKGGVIASTSKGVWATDYSGAVRLLFRTGDSIGGETLAAFTLLNATPGSAGVTRSFNDSGQVAWLAKFRDKTQAIVITQVP